MVAQVTVNRFKWPITKVVKPRVQEMPITKPQIAIRGGQHSRKAQMKTRAIKNRDKIAEWSESLVED